MTGIGLITLKATVAILAALLAGTAARRARASMRHSVYAALFIALLMLPVAPALLPETKLPVPESVIASAVEREGAPELGGPSPSSRLGMTPASRSAMTPWAVVRTVYFGGVALLLASLIVGIWRLRRWANDADIWLEGTKLAADVASENHIRRAVLVVVSQDTEVPLTFGFRRQTIVMPLAAAEWPVEALRRAIRHELEHVRRDDWAMQLIARVAAAVYWPHPLVWVALRRFCLEAERACDDAVVHASDAPAYADQLLTLARTIDHRPAVPALAMASRSRLSERVRAILDPKQPRGPQSRAALLLTASAMVAVTLTFGSVQLVAAATEELDFDYRDSLVQAAEKGKVEALELFILRGGIDINEPIVGDGTLILIASRAGRIDAVRWLLDHGADPNVPSPGDGNALIAAAGAGQTKVMRMLLAAGARVEDVVPGDENALITAAAEGSDQAVKLLIEHGANVNSRVWADNREWRTPLSMARRNGHRDIERILTNAGARD